jgi:hypothetical protein
MPIAYTPANIIVLRGLRGFMVATIADRPGIPFKQAEETANGAADAGLIRHEFHTVTLTAEGKARGSVRTVLPVSWSAIFLASNSEATVQIVRSSPPCPPEISTLVVHSASSRSGPNTAKTLAQ